MKNRRAVRVSRTEKKNQPACDVSLKTHSNPKLKINWEDFQKNTKFGDYFFVTDPVVLVNQIKAHGLSCRISLSWQAKNHSSTLFYGRELLTDCGDQRAC